MQDWFEIVENIHPDKDYVLALLFQVQGSSYKRPGTIALVNSEDCIGLISGGCLEDDLKLRSQSVIEAKTPCFIQYDLKNDDEVWGLGAGCEGILDIFLMPLLKEKHHANFMQVLAVMTSRNFGVTSIDNTNYLTANFVLSDTHTVPISINSNRESYYELLNNPQHRLQITNNGQRIYQLPLEKPKVITIAGAGRDSHPLIRGIIDLGWRVNLIDHRPYYLELAVEKFSSYKAFNASVIKSNETSSIALQEILDLTDALLLMTHKVELDSWVLKHGLQANLGYIGLLGPKLRANKIFAKISEQLFQGFSGHLSSPVGIDIGSYTPASIALSILSELHQFFFKREAKCQQNATGLDESTHSFKVVMTSNQFKSNRVKSNDNHDKSGEVCG